MKLAAVSAIFGPAVLAAVLSAPAYLQATISFALVRVNGTVLDPGGRSVAGANVVLRNLDTNQSFTGSTSGSGFYVVPSLPPGRYELTTTYSGFGKFTETGIELSVGQTATVNVTLKAAATTETVNVTDVAPTVELTRTGDQHAADPVASGEWTADMAPIIFSECPDQSGMHFNGPDNVLAEMIDVDSGDVLPAETRVTGELVYTSLERECVPLLRFRTRDRVTMLGTTCPCGRTGFKLRCLGRTDDMLIVLGVNVFPSAIKDVVSSFHPPNHGRNSDCARCSRAQGGTSDEDCRRVWRRAVGVGGPSRRDRAQDQGDPYG
jgi:acyl-CoA synthetase (AMP-forming)/AMP-acid ligase II